MKDSSGRLAVTGAVHIWHGRAPHTPDPADLAVLDDEELRLVHSRRAAVRSHYAHAHASLRRVLADHYLGGPPEAIRFGRHPCPRCEDGRHGRPRVLSPATGMEFSLSRSGPHWALAVTAAGHIGLDIESRGDLDADALSGLVLSGLVLSGGERDRIRAAGHGDTRRELFLRAWTRKEAVLKAVGVGIATDLSRLDVRVAEQGPVRVEHIERDDRSHWLVDEPELAPGLVAALARRADRPGPVVVRGVPFRRTGNEAHGAMAVPGPSGGGSAR
ncbi:4'-phosphopantetheinyl transferase family protein [Streptomyces sp. NPDC002164]|uniref:4'-phosphopantetheinyl transferase family protein n=1 Tax=Streptomyces sp. NPDC002164 TaxID=3364633 RepID=UPI0036C906D2